MKQSIRPVLAAGGLLLGMASAAMAAFPATPVKKCGADAVMVGSVCLDTYEASVWRVLNPTTTNKALVKKLQQGKASLADLLGAGATQLGIASDDYAPCADTGQNCANDIFAASLAGVVPSRHLTWFQAQEACLNAAKRLPTNAEWQGGANGSPDPGGDNGTTDCNTASTLTVDVTGGRSSCVSARGAFDMVGNLFELVADWWPLMSGCAGWGSFSNDLLCISFPDPAPPGPGVLIRGGYFETGAGAGPLTLSNFLPSISNYGVGFRCAR